MAIAMVIAARQPDGPAAWVAMQSVPQRAQPMNLIDRSSSTEPAAELSAALGKWYDAHAQVRRLWATEDSGALRVFVTLEPTYDDDDMLPVWLANGQQWASDLQSLTQRDVRLEVIVSAMLGEESQADGGTVLAQLDWREAWTSSSPPE